MKTITTTAGQIQIYKGLALPAHEQHLITWMEDMGRVVDGKPAYQYHKLEAALGHVKNWGCAVDVGAHCGLWSMHLVKKFKTLHAFEPVALHRECFQRNVMEPLPPNLVVLHPCALGEKHDMVNIHTSAGSSGDSWVSDAGNGFIPLEAYDEEMPSYITPKVGFVKLDCEGYEYPALKGMEQMLLRDRPTVLVEQKKGRAQKFGFKETQACTYLESLKFKRQFVMSGDYCYTGA